MITAMPRIAIAARDFDALVSVFRDRFGMPLVDISSDSVPGLGAKLALCVPAGGSNIELMSPADPATPLSQSLQKFLDRRGEGLFALMLEAPDPDAEADLLRGRGLNVLPLMAGAAGRDVHPNSTNGVLIRVYPVNSFQAVPEQIQQREDRSLGLTGVCRVIIAVRDLEAASAVYGAGLGLPVAAPARDARRGVSSVTVRPPAGGVIELVSVADPQCPFAASIATHLATRGEGMYALVLQVSDAATAVASLGERGIEVSDDGGQPGPLEVDAASVFGTRILLEDLA
ncbi:MAG: VOC family protein [Pseudomonadales bacterium]|nr:VOC family protein [Pseudomonadales bacterium]